MLKKTFLSSELSSFLCVLKILIDEAKEAYPEASLEVSTTGEGQ
jgi:hypothetical protein